MTKKSGSGEMLHYLGLSPYKNPDAKDGPVNTATKFPGVRYTETITHKLQTESDPQNRESSGISFQASGGVQNGITSVARPSQPVIPDGVVRGRDKARKGGRASSSGSNNSSKEREKRELAEAARKNCFKALRQFKVDGGIRGLAQHARDHGIPEDLRREIWPILLSNHPSVLNKHIAREFTDGAENGEELREIPYKRIQRELERYHRRMKKIPTTTRNGSPSSNPSPVSSTLPNGAFKEPDAALLDQAALDVAVEGAIVSFLGNHDQVNYAPGMVYVCLTLADWLFMPSSIAAGMDIDCSHDADILSSCFEKMMYVILWSPIICSTPIEPSDSVINQRISHFLTTFRQLLPELARYFDEEEVASFGEKWVFTWIQWWCAGELEKDEKGRLWDWYLGFEQPAHGVDFQQTRSNATRGDCVDSRGFHLDDIYYPSDWHILVCVALLKSCKDALEELEQSEIRSVLTRLPKVDMNLIIEEAKSLRVELRDILEREEEDYANRSTGEASNE